MCKATFGVERREHVRSVLREKLTPPKQKKHRAVVAVEKSTKRVICRFSSINEARISAGVDAEKIYEQAKLKTLPKGNVYWRFVDEYDPHEDFAGHDNRPVYVDDLLENQRSEYANASEAANALCYVPSSIRHAIRKGDVLGKRYKVGWLQ